MKQYDTDITNTVVSILAQKQLDGLNGTKFEDFLFGDGFKGVLKYIINLPGLNNNEGRDLAMIFYHLNAMGEFNDIADVYNQLPQHGNTLDAHTRQIIDAITTHKEQPNDYTYQNFELNTEIKKLLSNPTPFNTNVAKLLNSYDPTSLKEEKHAWVAPKNSSAGTRFIYALYNERCGSMYLAKREYTALASLPRKELYNYVHHDDLIK